MKPIVYFNNSQKKEKITPEIRRLLKTAVQATLEYEKFASKAEVSVTFVDNEQIQELNKEHRQIDKATDVLSFPMLEGEEGIGDADIGKNAILLGDIVLSVEKANEQAEEYGHSLERELAFLTVHSVLHLLGYDHEEAEEAENDMRRRQREILDSMGLSRTETIE